MADYVSGEMFKVVRRGGYDKDEVEQQFNALKNSTAEEKNKLLLVLKSKEKKIGELTEQNAAKDKEIARLEAEVKQLRKDIDEKYKTYIENYDTIGQLIYDARIRANQMIKEAEKESSRLISVAEEKSGRMVKDAEAESGRILKAAKESAAAQLGVAQNEMDQKIKDGRRSYAALQDEIAELVQEVNSIQRQFMKSIKNIHELSDSVLKIKIEDTDYDEAEELRETEDFDEADDYDEPRVSGSAFSSFGAFSPEDESRFLEEAMAMKD